jgi:hypothetical protein
VEFDSKQFCYSGCKTVFEILSSSDACEYYRFEEHPGLKAGNRGVGSRYAYLDNDEIRRELSLRQLLELLASIFFLQVIKSFSDVFLDCVPILQSGSKGCLTGIFLAGWFTLRWQEH